MGRGGVQLKFYSNTTFKERDWVEIVLFSFTKSNFKHSFWAPRKVILKTGEHDQTSKYSNDHVNINLRSPKMTTVLHFWTEVCIKMITLQLITEASRGVRGLGKKYNAILPLILIMTPMMMSSWHIMTPCTLYLNLTIYFCKALVEKGALWLGGVSIEVHKRG